MGRADNAPAIDCLYALSAYTECVFCSPLPVHRFIRRTTKERGSILLWPWDQADVSVSLDELAKDDADTEGDLPEPEDLRLCNRGGAHTPRVRPEDDVWATLICVLKS
jgi:hypothetical protein